PVSPPGPPGPGALLRLPQGAAMMRIFRTARAPPNGPPSRPRPPARFRPTAEPLECRVLPVNPSVVDPNLAVRTVVSGLDQPTSMAFLGDNDFFVLEKATGKVQHVVNGAVTTVLDLAVNNNSERGLLGIALDPDFATNHAVYLYWTQSAPHPAPGADPHFPTQIKGPDTPALGADTGNVLATPLRGNRVDRFLWNGSTLTWDSNLIRLRSFQFDATNGVPRGNHNGGGIKFGPDGKLYGFIGDNGGRGGTPKPGNGPLGPGQNDDQFGGPEPDDAHLTGVVLRLNTDGSAPADNPFADIGHVFVARLEGNQEVPGNASPAKGYAAFFLNKEMTSLTFTVTVTGLDFTGSQTADPRDDLFAAHIHAGGPRGPNPV